MTDDTRDEQVEFLEGKLSGRVTNPRTVADAIFDAIDARFAALTADLTQRLADLEHALDVSDEGHLGRDQDLHRLLVWRGVDRPETPAVTAPRDEAHTIRCRTACDVPNRRKDAHGMCIEHRGHPCIGCYNPPAAAPSGESPCIVCHQPVMDIGPKSSIPGRNGWAHAACAAAPSEDAHHKTSEARRNALMEAEGSHSSAASTSPAGGGSEEPALSSPAPVERAEGPERQWFASGRGIFRRGEGMKLATMVATVDWIEDTNRFVDALNRADLFDELAEALRVTVATYRAIRILSAGEQDQRWDHGKAIEEGEALLAKLDAARGKR